MMVRRTAGATARSLRVLVVEDEFLIRWSIVETLTDAGHIVLEAENAAAARAALADSAHPIDAAVLDYRLPDSSELALLADVRRMRPESPVILMTAYGSADIEAGARELGAYT